MKSIKFLSKLISVNSSGTFCDSTLSILVPTAIHVNWISCGVSQATMKPSFDIDFIYRTADLPMGVMVTTGLWSSIILIKLSVKYIWVSLPFNVAKPLSYTLSSVELTE